MLPIKYLLRSLIPKNLRIWALARSAHARENVYTQKITGSLEINVFLRKLTNAFHLL